MTRLWLTKDRPGLSSERAPHSRNNKFQTQLLEKEAISGQMSIKWAQHQDILTDWLTVSRKVTLTLTRSILPSHLPSCAFLTAVASVYENAIAYVLKEESRFMKLLCCLYVYTLLNYRTARPIIEIYQELQDTLGHFGLPLHFTNAIINERTNSGELNHFRKAASRPTTQEFPNSFWNRKVRHRVYNSPPLVPIASRSLQSIPPKICTSMRSSLVPILRHTYTRSLPKGIFHSGFLITSPVSISLLLHASYMSCPPLPPWLDHSNSSLRKFL
jgi:hypothetical protein